MNKIALPYSPIALIFFLDHWIPFCLYMNNTIKYVAY